MILPRLSRLQGTRFGNGRGVRRSVTPSRAGNGLFVPGSGPSIYIPTMLHRNRYVCVWNGRKPLSSGHPTPIRSSGKFDRCPGYQTISATTAGWPMGGFSTERMRRHPCDSRLGGSVTAIAGDWSIFHSNPGCQSDPPAQRFFIAIPSPYVPPLKRRSRWTIGQMGLRGR